MDHTVLLRLTDVLRRCVLRRSTVYRLAASGQFPVPIKVGTPQGAWLKHSRKLVQLTQNPETATRQTRV
jgi:predicted DNA-binding transcriptional regulator AlpA